MNELRNYEGDLIPDNLAVITTKSVMNAKATIQLVTRDSDGDWQFLPHMDTLDMDDALVVAIKNLLRIDATLLDVMHLQRGEQAWRATPKDHWTIINPDLNETEI